MYLRFISSQSVVLRNNKKNVSSFMKQEEVRQTDLTLFGAFGAKSKKKKWHLRQTKQTLVKVRNNNIQLPEISWIGPAWMVQR